MIGRAHIYSIVLLIVILFDQPGPLQAQDEQYQKDMSFNDVEVLVQQWIDSGREIFRTNCAPCHGVHREIAGPLLASITKKRSLSWLVAFIRNSQDIILSGDHYSNFLFEKYNHMVMPSFDGELSESEIKNILTYIEHESSLPHQNFADFSVEAGREGELIDQRGKALFDNQCSSCHFIGKEGYGPALGSITKRRPDDWLLAFIRNSQAVIHSGDVYANQLYLRFNRKEMVSMNFLSDAQIHSILDYIEFSSASPRDQAGENGRKATYSTPPSGVTDGVEGALNIGETRFRVFIIMTILVSIFVISLLLKKLFLYLK